VVKRSEKPKPKRFAFNFITTTLGSRVFMMSTPGPGGSGSASSNSQVRFNEPGMRLDPKFLVSAPKYRFPWTMKMNLQGATQIGSSGAKGTISSEFFKGGSWLMTQQQYHLYVRGAPMVGRPQGQFVTPKPIMDKVIRLTGADSAKMQRLLSTEGWEGQTMFRIDVDRPLLYNLRLPKVTSPGANRLFVEGGKTAHGLPEGLIDPVPAKEASATLLVPRARILPKR